MIKKVQKVATYTIKIQQALAVLHAKNIPTKDS